MVLENHGDIPDREDDAVEGREDSPDQENSADGGMPEPDDSLSERVADNTSSDANSGDVSERDSSTDNDQTALPGPEPSTSLPNADAPAMPHLTTHRALPPAAAYAINSIDAPTSAGIGFGDTTDPAPLDDASDDPVIGDRSGFNVLPEAFSERESPATAATPRQGFPDESTTRHRDAASRVERAFVRYATPDASQADTRKRLEIEVEVSVANMEQLTRIAVDESKHELKLIAYQSVDEVRSDLYKLRSELRAVWGRY